VSVEAQTRAPERNTQSNVGIAASVGIMAYNEEANIGAAVDSILSQALHTGTIAELIQAFPPPCSETMSAAGFVRRMLTDWSLDSLE
jgi:hypothetical protein